jgi:hypothetical protein
MRTLIGSSRTLYAAIEAHHTDGGHERFVIAYTCERSLRELLAGPSIVASGCPTREYAEKICYGETPRRDVRKLQTLCGLGFKALLKLPLLRPVAGGSKRFVLQVLHYAVACFRREPLHADGTAS